jgi:hypothetical protein
MVTARNNAARLHHEQAIVDLPHGLAAGRRIRGEVDELPTQRNAAGRHALALAQAMRLTCRITCADQAAASPRRLHAARKVASTTEGNTFEETGTGTPRADRQGTAHCSDLSKGLRDIAMYCLSARLEQSGSEP